MSQPPTQPSAPSSAPLWLTVYSDGASRGNPGPSAAGFVIYDTAGQIVKEGSAYLGFATNNEAEYQAAILGVQAALALGAQHIRLRADSELLILQLKGRYQVRKESLKPLYLRLKALLASCQGVALEHVPRAANARADAAANQALDAQKAAQGR